MMTKIKRNEGMVPTFAVPYGNIAQKRHEKMLATYKKLYGTKIK